MLTSAVVLGIIFIFVFFILPSIRVIGPTEVGLVMKRFGWKHLIKDSPIAFRGEPGYQATLLMPGWRFKFWVVYSVTKHPWVQIPAGEIGVVIAQVGQPLPIGAKSAVFKSEFGNFSDLPTFINAGGQKGVQRPVLPPGSMAPIHPVAFLVLTKHRIYGVPISQDLFPALGRRGPLSAESFGLRPEQLNLTVIEPHHAAAEGEILDVVGIVTTFEGDPLPSGDIASRLGGYADVLEAERAGKSDSDLMQAILAAKNEMHNNYQDYQAFLDHGGKIGLQHDPLLYGAYALNPFLVSVEIQPMLVVKQGQVAVIKAYVGLPSVDTSGAEFKFGSIVKPGHRGIWQEALRTGKYPINPRCYQAEVVPTSILTLNWAEASSTAHNLDRQLKQIVAKSREGFIFNIDLQVQIHVPDTQAPRVISMVGTMQNLVNEVLQAAVGNHFRDKLQSMPAVSFIETRQTVQQDAFEHIRLKLEEYKVETRGVYIQDVILPEELVRVLKDREIANQEIATYRQQRQAEDTRTERERAAGLADQQKALAQAEVNVSIKENNAKARKAEADGEAYYTSETGTAKGAEVRAVGMARAEAYKNQVDALGQQNTAIVNAITAMAERGAKFMPDILVMGGNPMDGASAALTEFLQKLVGRGGGSWTRPVAGASASSVPTVPPAPPMPPTEMQS
jgi:regulator of protease activity HflC (stomatin/prohibitin superfamily)